MLKSSLVNEEINLNFTVKRKPNQKSVRSRSLSRNMTLPETNVTISLPASRQMSRNTSVDREVTIVKKSNNLHGSSMEIFNGSYDMVVQATSKKAPVKIHEKDTHHEVKRVTMTSSEDVSQSESEKKVVEKECQVYDEGQKTEVVQSTSENEVKELLNAKVEMGGSEDNTRGVGDALRGLTEALENVQMQQSNQRSNLLNHVPR